MKSRSQIDLHKFFHDQLSRWPLACENHRGVKRAKVKPISILGHEFKAHFLPKRIISTAAEKNPQPVCCFCPENRPAEQISLPFDGRKGKKYDILVNPYPIYDHHFIVALHEHAPQSITNRYVDILDLSAKFTGYTFFYNGPTCGASVPGHHHFQACPSGQMPVEKAIIAALTEQKGLTFVDRRLDASLYHWDAYLPGYYVIKSHTTKSAAKLFYRLLDCAPMPKDPAETEPRFNLVTLSHGGEFISIIVFRTQHRSRHYYASEESGEHLLMSPGTADVMGNLIMPSEADFENPNIPAIEEMLAEVVIPSDKDQKILERLSRTQQTVQVPLATSKEFVFEVFSDGAGNRKVKIENGKLLYCGAYYDELYFDAPTLDRMFAQESFTLAKSHFAGALRFAAQDDNVVAYNILGLEDYVLSALSEEKDEPLDALKSRCKEVRAEALKGNFPLNPYERAIDKNCPNVRRAIDATWGQTI